MRIDIKNIKKYQHYRDRNPPWIKLQRSLLDDFKFASMNYASRMIAIMLWLLASEYHDGVIIDSEAQIAWRLHVRLDELTDALATLQCSGFVTVSDSASTTQANREQSDTTETESETKREVEAEAKRETECGIIQYPAYIENATLLEDQNRPLEHKLQTFDEGEAF